MRVRGLLEEGCRTTLRVMFPAFLLFALATALGALPPHSEDQRLLGAAKALEDPNKEIHMLAAKFLAEELRGGWGTLGTLDTYGLTGQLIGDDAAGREKGSGRWLTSTRQCPMKAPCLAPCGSCIRGPRPTRR